MKPPAESQRTGREVTAGPGMAGTAGATWQAQMSITF